MIYVKEQLENLKQVIPEAKDQEWTWEHLMKTRNYVCEIHFIDQVVNGPNEIRGSLRISEAAPTVLIDEWIYTYW